MASNSLDKDNVDHTGTHTFSGTVNLPASTVGGTQMSTGDTVPLTKQQHRHEGKIGQNNGTDGVAQTRVVHIARKAGTVEEFAITCETAPAGGGDQVINYDLHKNGSTILSSTVQMAAGDSNYEVKTGTISSAAYVAGDVFEIVITVAGSSGTQGDGPFAVARFDEDP